MDKIDRESYQVARRMTRIVAANHPAMLDDNKRRKGWDDIWGACLTGLAAQYGWAVARAIGGSVFAWRSIAQDRYQWVSNDRRWRFYGVQYQARRRELGL